MRAKENNSVPGQPLPIAQGTDAVLFASCEVHQEPDKIFAGTIFPQGIFFAHEPEASPSFGVLLPGDNEVGMSSEMYRTKKRAEIEKAKNWAR